MALRKERRQFYKTITPYLLKSPENPFFTCNTLSLYRRVNALKKGFLPGHQNAHIAYAVKSNPDPKILKRLAQIGISTFDCASFSEIESVQRHVPNAKILFDHTIKTRKDIKLASQSKVNYYSAQSKGEIDKILHSASNGDNIEIVIRIVTPNNKAKVQLSKKFGTSEENAIILLQQLIKMGHQKIGVSIHTGSQNLDPTTYRDGVECIARVLAQLDSPKLSSINFGGGFPANYKPSDQFSIAPYLDQLNQAIQNLLPSYLNSETQMYLELGRAIIAESIQLITPIISAEIKDGIKRLTIAESLYGSFLALALHNHQFYFKPLPKSGKELTSEREEVIIHGRTCDSKDILGSYSVPMNLGEGDRLFFPSMGAYTSTHITTFNGFEPPPLFLY